jgi:twinkle protein
MTDEEPEVIDLASYRGRHGQAGYFALADLPQKGSIEEQSFGTGWWELDQIFKFYLGQFVVVTGIAGHGKSTFLLNVICNLARERGLKSFLYVPENEAYLFDKIKKIWGAHPGFDHLAQSQIFVQSATPQSMDDPAKNLDWVLEQAVVAVQEDHVELVMIDPWNELERSKPKDMLMTDHIGECLMLIKQFCRMFNVIVIMVAHPTKSVFEHGGRPVSLADIEGSMNWFNKCDNGLIVSRDEQDRAKVASRKVRELGAGKLGDCYFNVNPNTGIFTPIYGGVS